MQKDSLSRLKTSCLGGAIIFLECTFVYGSFWTENTAVWRDWG